MVDSHCHLDAVDFVHDLAEVLARARQTGVERFVTIGSGRGTDSAPDAVALANSHDGVVACVGIHPLDAACATPHVMRTIESLAEERRVVGIGETGLDYRLDSADKTAQREAFRQQIRLARRVMKPLVIHTYAAAAETLTILCEEGAGNVGGVIHSFAADQALASGALDLGFDISFSALLLLHDLPGVVGVAKTVPLDRLLIESNAPRLAPPPDRARRCEPSDLGKIADGLAAMLGLGAAELRARAAENAVRRFRLV
jgi:TatD DNase family protein